MPALTAPYGSWRSPIRADAIASGTLRLSGPRLDGGALYWVEGRPTEGGRAVLVRESGGEIRDLSPAGRNVRSRVHEYGGGAYVVRDGRVICADFAGGILQVQAPGQDGPLPDAKSERHYADFELSPDGRWLLAVEEEHPEGREAENRIVALPLAGGEPLVVSSSHDFVSFPRFAPDGRSVCFTAWDHPRMPWDGTLLYERTWNENGPAGEPRLVAGGETESVFQPGFSPGGRLTFVSDRSGWWNLYQEREGRVVALHPASAEFGRPQWVFGLSSWAFLDEAHLLCLRSEGGRDRLGRLTLESGRLDDVDLPYTAIEGLGIEAGTVCFLGAGPTHPGAVCRLDLESGRVTEVRSAFDAPGRAWISVPEAIEFPTANGLTAHAFLYRPTGDGVGGPAAEPPPLLVKTHGGPTAATTDVLDLGVQFWTSRGFAVLDVNYGGSTGYGRAYRERLLGQWGVVDVEDALRGALYVAERGIADRGRLAIRGGSAGGYTTLCALTFHDVFRAGASHYGIGDLEALVRDTHKFEARYLDGLIGPHPERADLYRARSPIHHVERLSCPVIFFQGLEDRVVPPAQAEAMVAALAARGVPHAYVPFPGEQHGFRRAENIRAALEGELYFYGRIFGFEVDVEAGAVKIVGLATMAP